MSEPTNWRTERSRKSAQTRKAKYGENIFKELGRKGGKVPNPRQIDDLPIVEQYEVLASDPFAR